MLDNILNTVRQGVEQVQRRGEELTQVARLKVEVFQLARDLDAHFARLGRAYHSGAERDLLSGIQEEIRRTEGEIRNREALIAELGDDGSGAAASAPAAETTAVELHKGSAPVAPQPTPVTSPASQVPSAAQTPGTAQAAAPLPSNRPSFVDEAGKPDVTEPKNQ